ncbi:MAG: integrase core domain-containing protein [Candidatus Dormibacteraceae bacterium]
MTAYANAHVERWIGSCRRECLDRMLVVNQRHLEAILCEYCMHYNQERPHRSRELRPPAARGDPVVAGTRGVLRRVLWPDQRVPQRGSSCLRRCFRASMSH